MELVHHLLAFPVHTSRARELSGFLAGVHLRHPLATARALHARVEKRRARLARRRRLGRRADFVRNASRITPHVAVERDGALFFLPTRKKDGVDRFRKDEWKERRHLKRALDALDEAGFARARKTFIDVGAHIGTTTITAVRGFGFEAAVAFEPELSNFLLLRANLGINDLEARIRTFHTAVSDRTGSGELALRPELGSKHRLLGDDEQTGESVRVPLTTLDSLVAEGSLDPDDASLLWLDVEGHELEVLSGAEQLLARSVPIVMEFAPLRLVPNGRLGALRSLLAPHYTHVLDLRPRATAIRPLGALPELAEHYHRGFTDLLVFRLPPSLPRAA